MQLSNANNVNQILHFVRTIYFPQINLVGNKQLTNHFYINLIYYVYFHYFHESKYCQNT